MNESGSKTLGPWLGNADEKLGGQREEHLDLEDETLENINPRNFKGCSVMGEFKERNDERRG